jgi:hypothetical protein
MSLFDGELSIALSRITKSFGPDSHDIATLTTNARPFSTDHKYPDLVETVREIVNSRDFVRSSNALGSTLKEIIDACLVVVCIVCISISYVLEIKLAIEFMSAVGMLLEYAKCEATA